MRWLPGLQELLLGWDADRLMDQPSLAQALGTNFERSMGPTFHGHLPREKLDGLPAVPGIRKLQPEDERAIHALRAACGRDWEVSGLQEAEGWRHACFEREKITAMAGYRAKSDQAGEPCILTHPDFRGQRRGTAVARAVVREALAHGKLLLSQTLESNSSARRIALALGYERYATHLAVRLESDSP
jgi:GNAT superfamily N-acetyltransferase